MAVAQVFDGEQVIFTTKPTKLPEEHNQAYFAVKDAAEEKAKTWLTEKYPDWDNAGAYWDD